MKNLTMPPSSVGMPAWIESFISSSPSECAYITADFEYRKNITEQCRSLADLAYTQSRPEALEALHECLSIIYACEFSAAPLMLAEADIRPVISDISCILEQAMFAHECAAIESENIETCPRNGAAYVAWLKQMIKSHPAGRHAFYDQFLSVDATTEDIRFFLAQETNLDPRFDDILARLQMSVQGRAKMEIAENYWDEMGNGNPKNVHTFLFQKALDALDVNPAYIANVITEEARISGNLSAALALNKRHYYKSIGYFGVTESIVPWRFKHFVEAWHANGLPQEAVAYHDLHIRIDAKHGTAWFNNVIAPAVDDNPQAGIEIAKGALIRLNSSARYLDSMLNHLQVKKQIASAA